MPRITQDYNLKKPGPVPGAKYPIDEWLAEIKKQTNDWKKKGSKGEQPSLQLDPGVDFTTTTSSMAEYLWKYRRERELPIRISENAERVLIFWVGN